MGIYIVSYRLDQGLPFERGFLSEIDAIAFGLNVQEVDDLRDVSIRTEYVQMGEV